MHTGLADRLAGLDGRMTDEDAQADSDQGSGEGAEARDPRGAGTARFREVLGHFATGVTVVTALEDGVPAGFTCQAFTSLSLDPPMVAIAPAKSSTSWPRMIRAGAFCVNMLSQDQESLCRAFAVSGGDKFEGVGWRIGRAGTPVLEGALAWVECELGAVYDAGDHELVTGHVLHLGVGDGSGPLLFYRGGFGRFL